MKENKIKVSDFAKIGDNEKLNVELTEDLQGLANKVCALTVKKHEFLIGGVDLGSDTSRVILIKNLIPTEEELTKQFIIPTAVKVVGEKVELQKRGPFYYDQMDSTIVNLSDNDSPIVGKVRVVRGRKFEASDAPAQILGSGENKSNESALYYNLLDSLGYSVMQKYGTEIPEEVTTTLSLSLPPDEMATIPLINKFRNKIEGSYIWTHVDTGTKIKFNIIGVKVLSEPEAFELGYYNLVAGSVPTDNVIVFNGGGRSIGIELMQGGVCNPKYSTAIKVGGNHIANALGEKCLIMPEVPISEKQSLETLKTAVKTGYIPQGRTGRVDVMPAIEEVFEEFGDRFYSYIKNEILGKAGLTIKDIGEVLVSGGIFKSGDYDKSIADSLEDTILELSEFTEFTCIAYDNYIPQGLALAAFNTFRRQLEDFLAKRESEEEVAIDSIESDLETI